MGLNDANLERGLLAFDPYCEAMRRETIEREVSGGDWVCQVLEFGQLEPSRRRRSGRRRRAQYGGWRSDHLICFRSRIWDLARHLISFTWFMPKHNMRQVVLVVLLDSSRIVDLSFASATWQAADKIKHLEREKMNTWTASSLIKHYNSTKLPIDDLRHRAS